MAELDDPLTGVLHDIEEEDGVSSRRTQLLLWVVRERFDVSAADSYANVLEDEAGKVASLAEAPVDAVIATSPQADSKGLCTFLVYDNGHAESILTKLGALLSGDQDQVETLLRQVSRSRRIASVLADAGLKPSTVSNYNYAVLLVSQRELGRRDRRRLETAISAEDVRFEVLDAEGLQELSRAVTEPGTFNTAIKLQIPRGERLVTQAGGSRVLVAPVPGKDIAEWNGVASRRLFDLNVRFGLGINRVRRSIDKALSAPEEEQAHFLAHHNGLTVVCNDIEELEDSVTIRGLSVVNGAQSVIALYENRKTLTDALHVLVKFVQVAPGSELARNIAIRSNTQNPVTTRNLRALDAVQLRLVRELAHGGYNYTIRPDAYGATDQRTIRNDDAAQLLCGIYLAEPWLAVKRAALFAQGTYEKIFPSNLDAGKVVLADLIARTIATQKSMYGEQLRTAWRLTALTGAYVVGELLRVDSRAASWFSEPPLDVGDQGDVQSVLNEVGEFAAKFLAEAVQHGHIETQSGRHRLDDFKVDFKRQSTLRPLGQLAAQRWSISRRSGNANGEHHDG